MANSLVYPLEILYHDGNVWVLVSLGKKNYRTFSGCWKSKIITDEVDFKAGLSSDPALKKIKKTLLFD